MNKNIILLGALLSSTIAFSQQGRVGVNTNSPKTTMDISGKTANADGSGTVLATDMTGLQAPRITRADLTAKGNSLYGTDQKGALIYITDVSGGNNTSQRVNVTAVGYYYFDGTVWVSLGGGTVPSGIDLTNDEWINDTTNTMVKLGKKSDGSTARDTGTDFVAKDNGYVGIGTTVPDTKLHIVTDTSTINPNPTGFKLEDGNQGAGRVLMSDANGVGTWKINSMYIINGHMGPGVNLALNDTSNKKDWTNPNDHSNGFKSTGSYIALPPGKWQVNVAMLIPYNPGSSNAGLTANDWLWVRSSFSESATNVTVSPDVLSGGITKYASGNFQGPTPGNGNYVTRHGILIGTVFINNQSLTTKTYYYNIGGWEISSTNLPGKLDQIGGHWGEDSITAFPIQQ